MRIAIVGSRNLRIDHMEDFLPKQVTEIISGGAIGIDLCAKRFAMERNIKLTEFLPDYKRYGKCAPLKRNEQIVNHAEKVLAFWDGKSRGTKYTIDYAKKQGIDVQVVLTKERML